MERGEAVGDGSIVQPSGTSATDADAGIDTVAIFAPSGYDGDPERLRQATLHLEARGARVVTRLAVGGRHDRFSGDDAERLRWFESVVDDPAIGIAMALRGGYGATRLLPSIDFDAMAASVRAGKRFVGHSDFTVVTLALLARTGAVSFAGPMASYDFGGASVDAFTDEHFGRAMHEARVDAAFATDATDETTLDTAGILWGGNLTMLTSLLGTPWMPRIEGGILFVEDINEQPYRIERMLLQLHQAGVLDRQRLVLCGDFSGVRIAPYDQGYDVAAALDHVRSVTRTPLASGLPFGHCPSKLTLAVGARADVRIADGLCRLQQRWDLAD